MRVTFDIKAYCNEEVSKQTWESVLDKLVEGMEENFNDIRMSIKFKWTVDEDFKDSMIP